MLGKYFKNLYKRTMHEAYSLSHREIIAKMEKGGKCLDCGANEGDKFDLIKQKIEINIDQYTGIEWSANAVSKAQAKGLNVMEGDLNKTLPFEDKEFDLIFGLSVVEHLLHPCRYLSECKRVLKDDGTLIILTPNISTLFTAALILMGRMPSSGPHPDSDQLIKKEEIFKVSSDNLRTDADSDTPSHRHLVVFSFRVLRDYLKLIGFSQIRGYGFGLYPFPNFIQPLLEKIDPYHCHQMVFIVKK